MILSSLVKREIKAFLKSPAFIITLVLIFVFYFSLGNIMKVSVEEVKKGVAEREIGVVLGEDTELTRVLVGLLRETMSGQIRLYASIQDAVKSAGTCLYIPEGFSSNATSGESILVLNGVVNVESLSSVLIQAKMSTLAQISNLMEKLVPIAVSIVYGSEPHPTRFSVTMRSSTLFYGREIRGDLLVSLSSVLTMLPLLITIVVGLNAGYASQLVALEKAEKAFEMLLSQPIKRSSIVIAKIIGASLATMLFAAVYVAGLVVMSSYALLQGFGDSSTSLFEVLSEMSRAFGVDLSSAFLISICMALVLGLISSGSIGIILGSISPDERVASLLAMPIMFLYFGIAFMFTYLSIELNAYIALLSGVVVVPLPIIYVMSLVIGQPIYALISIASCISMCALQIAVATLIFNRDIVILGIRLRIKRRD